MLHFDHKAVDVWAVGSLLATLVRYTALGDEREKSILFYL
jgi:hypothetical protein